MVPVKNRVEKIWLSNKLCNIYYYIYGLGMVLAKKNELLLPSQGLEKPRGIVNEILRGDADRRMARKVSSKALLVGG